MAPHEFVEIRLVCKADYLDPQLKIKLHEIKDKLREILHTGRRRFALKKVQPWNSVKVTFDIPKEAADRLQLLAVQGNVRLIELGILSVEIVGQSNAIVVNSNNNNNNNNNNATTTTAATNPTTNSKDSSGVSSVAKSSIDTIESTAPVPSSSSSVPSTPISLPSSVTATTTHSYLYDIKTDEHRHKRIKIENDNEQQNYSGLNNTNFPYKSSTTVNLMQPPPPSPTVPQSNVGHPVAHYISQPNSQIIHRQPQPQIQIQQQQPPTPTNNYGRLTYPNSISPTHPTYINSGKPPPQPPPHTNPYQTQSTPTMDTNSTLSNGIGNDMHNYHHHHDSWSTYVDHSNNYKMKVNGIRSNHYYPQQQQLILSDGPSQSSNIYCTQPLPPPPQQQQQQSQQQPQQPPPQYDMRRLETNMATATNIQNSYDGSST